jgi:Ca-activated chloride channel family protein
MRQLLGRGRRLVRRSTAARPVDSITTIGRRAARRAAASAALLPLVLIPLVAQTPQFGTRVDVIEIYASVTDGSGEPLGGLAQDQFRVYEEGTLQEITTFVEAEFPLSVAIALDRSWSMAERLTRAKQAAATLIGALRADDQIMLVAIGSEVEIAAPLSGDRARLLDAVTRLDPWGTTPLNDAAMAAIARVQEGTGRRALVLLSDGDDRYSRASAADVLDAARRSDVMVYPVALGRSRPSLFVELAALTGGRSFQASDRGALDRTMRTIARELRTQYLLGYTPARPRSEGQGEWRAIRVEVRAPGAGVRARDGYVNE